MSIVNDLLFGKKKISNISLKLDRLSDIKIYKLASYEHYLNIKDSYLFKKYDPVFYIPTSVMSKQKSIYNNFVMLFPSRTITNYLLMDFDDDNDLAARTNFTFSGLSFASTNNYNLILKYKSFMPSNSATGASSLILRLKYTSNFYYEARVERNLTTNRISYLYYNGSGTVTQATGVTYNANGYLSISKNNNVVNIAYSQDGINYTNIYTRTDSSNIANTVCEISFSDTQSLVYYCAINFSYNLL